MSDPFRRVRPGEPLRIPAEGWNAAMAAAKHHARSRTALDGGQDAGREDHGVVLVRNDTEEDMDRYMAVALGAPITTPTVRLAGFQGRQALSGTTPVAASRGKFAVLLEPIRVGAVGRALVSGCTPTILLVPAPVDAPVDFADVRSGQKFLSASPSGAARVLWLQPEADRLNGGIAWAIVNLGEGTSPSGMFKVLVYKDGGSAGSVATNCSWTYTVKCSRGRTLGAAKTPKERRELKTVYTLTPDGTEGLGYYDENGTFQLWSANETFDMEDPCSSAIVDGGGAEGDQTETIDGGGSADDQTETIDGGG